jgi:hypothetical protein
VDFAKALQTIAQRMPLQMLVTSAIALLTLLSILAVAEILVVVYAMHSGQQISAALLYGKIDIKERPSAEEQRCKGIGDGMAGVAAAVDKIAATEYKQLGDMRAELARIEESVRTFINLDKPTQANDVRHTQVEPLIAEIKVRQETLDKRVQRTINDAVQACAKKLTA